MEEIERLRLDLFSLIRKKSVKFFKIFVSSLHILPWVISSSQSLKLARS
jgi:hypothetical protein